MAIIDALSLAETSIGGGIKLINNCFLKFILSGIKSSTYQKEDP